MPFVKELYIEYHETRGRSFLEPILSILENYYSEIEVEGKALKPFLALNRQAWWEREKPGNQNITCAQSASEALRQRHLQA